MESNQSLRVRLSGRLDQLWLAGRAGLVTGFAVALTACGGGGGGGAAGLGGAAGATAPAGAGVAAGAGAGGATGAGGGGGIGSWATNWSNAD